LNQLAILLAKPHDNRIFVAALAELRGGRSRTLV
jgi:hypothetical protein